jgi:transposase
MGPIEPFIPRQKAGPGRKRHDDRRVLNGMLFVLKTDCTWEDVPRAYGSLATRWRRFRSWAAEGAWEQIRRELLSQLNA